MEEKLFTQIREELVQDILPYWVKYGKDTERGGFFGAISNDNKGDPAEWRGIVMVSRFLWTYSAAARFLKDVSYMDMADWAYSYMMDKFVDRRNGGMFWSVKADGSPLVSRKQIYGNAFALYALSEYAAAIKEIRGDGDTASRVMGEAVDLFGLLEKFARDKEYGGYWEALTEGWQPTKDSKLSDKDIDCDKSMNTNLHVMEAYTNLYRNLPVVFPDKDAQRCELGAALDALVRVHIDKILDKNDWHLNLYFNKDWTQTGSDEISYGHDIEASWLLWEAAEVLADRNLKEFVRPVALAIADVSLKEGWDGSTGGYEDTMEPDGTRRTVRIWWNQAEALNGFYNAWEMTGESRYSDAVEKEWGWIWNYQKDKANGEWFWAVSKDGKASLGELKGGNWKTSYHNARCCMELLRRSGQ